MAAPGEGQPVPRFENNGLRGDRPLEEQGLFEFTHDPRDLGKFKPPSLRNVALTAPYMHDGSLPSLNDVLDHYARGGVPSPSRSPHITGLSLDGTERADLLAFFDSLTDEALLTDPRFADPWTGAEASQRE
jgi:cytochrome c peroxidase